MKNLSATLLFQAAACGRALVRQQTAANAIGPGRKSVLKLNPALDALATSPTRCLWWC